MVVVNHDAREVTLRCLDALAALTGRPDRLEVVLVDNASSDGLVGGGATHAARHVSR